MSKAKIAGILGLTGLGLVGRVYAEPIKSFDVYGAGIFPSGELVEGFGKGWGGGIGLNYGNKGIGLKLNIDYSILKGPENIRTEREFLRTVVEGQTENLNVISADLAFRVGQEIYAFAGGSFANFSDRFKAGKTGGREGYYLESSEDSQAFGGNFGGGLKFKVSKGKGDPTFFLEGVYRKLKEKGGKRKSDNLGVRAGIRF